MVHSLSNLKHHHSKYPQHRKHGQAHFHFFRAADFSFFHGIHLENGEIMQIEWEGLGKPLQNVLLKIDQGEDFISASFPH